MTSFSYASFNDNMDEFWLGKLTEFTESKHEIRSRTQIGTTLRSTTSESKTHSPTNRRYPSSSDLHFLDSMMSSCRSSDNAFCRHPSSGSLIEITAAEKSPVQAQRKLVLPSVSVTRLSFIIMFVMASVANMAWVNVDGPPKVSIGSAAISSLTEELSPILPFAGGLDLRRSDYWSTFDGDWFGTLMSVFHQANEAFVQRGEDNKQLKLETPVTEVPDQKLTKKGKSKLLNSISAPKPFVSVEKIADLTLAEVAVMFQYAVESSKPSFSMSRFVSHVGPNVRYVIDRMQDAVSKSRGHGVSGFVQSEIAGDEIDALKFAAAMRIFAEWRIVRLVPDGFKGFAVGMSLGHKDVVQNLGKIEDAAHAWLDSHRQTGHVMSPSLRELLTYELEVGIHPQDKLPRLTEKTAGMGLLWVSRQLTYQTQLFDNLVHSSKFTSSKDAISAAYKAVYDQYHGWAVQKIFSYSFQAAPEADVVLRHMNPRDNGDALVQSDAVQETKHAKKDRNSLEAILDGLFGVRDDANQPNGESTLSQELVGESHSRIMAYLNVAKPIIHNLQSMFSELNMNDPTRV